MEIDPVCLKQVDEDTAPEKVEYRGNMYYFDSERCKEVFESDPAQYAGEHAEIEYGETR